MDDISSTKVEWLEERVSEDLARLAKKYARNGPRYTSYPTAADFSPEFDGDQTAGVLRSMGARGRAVELYLHIPFCRERCSFCACSVVATPEYDRVAVPYVENLTREIKLVRRLLARAPKVSKLHLGGGTPTYLRPALLKQLLAEVDANFELLPDAELSIELDPRVTTPEHLDVLQAAGINRVSLGVQDLDREVQDQIGRHQYAHTSLEMIAELKSRGLDAINVDLVYGLPAQVPETVASTVEQIAEAGAQRIALYGYAHMPAQRGNQRQIDSSLLPNPDERLELLCVARDRLRAQGYELIGMDHFARPGDPLSTAKEDHSLRRNFMGYSTGEGDALIGLGVSAISSFGSSYAQNTTKLSTYAERLAEGRLPTDRGLWLSKDDSIRAYVIHELMCFGSIDRSIIDRRFMALNFDAYFESSLRRLAPMIADGLVTDDGRTIALTHQGELFVRNVAMCFDQRIQQRQRTPLVPFGRRGPRFSQTV